MIQTIEIKYYYKLRNRKSQNFIDLNRHIPSIVTFVLFFHSLFYYLHLLELLIMCFKEVIGQEHNMRKSVSNETKAHGSYTH
jgi:hypothetical protein